MLLAAAHTPTLGSSVVDSCGAEVVQHEANADLGRIQSPQIAQEHQELPAPLPRLDVAIQPVAAQVIGGQQVAHAVWAGVGRPATPPGLGASTTLDCPMAAGMGLEVERPELIHAEDHVGVAGFDVVGAIHEPVQVQDAVLLGFEVGVV
jgi:hypothetical protein